MEHGQVIAERYRVRGLRGLGATSEVFEVEDQVTGRVAALKLLARGRGGSRVEARLAREAHAMASLAHPHVLAVHAIGEHEGRPFIVADLAEDSLADRLREGRVELSSAIQWCVQVLSALAAAHDLGIVHRDVKPQNVLLDRHNRALLADFGIALVEGDERYTGTAIGMGSMSFMAPEQRLDARAVDLRADLYATGCTLYTLLTGETPVGEQLGLERMALADPVTGLLGDEGFRRDAGRALHFAWRNGLPWTLLRAEVRGPELPLENRREVAEAVAEAFGDSALLGVLSPGEFVALLPGGQDLRELRVRLEWAVHGASRELVELVVSEEASRSGLRPDLGHLIDSLRGSGGPEGRLSRGA